MLNSSPNAKNNPFQLASNGSERSSILEASEIGMNSNYSSNLARAYVDPQSNQTPVLSIELKKLRLRISDYLKSPMLDQIFHKVSSTVHYKSD